ncbi:hypothetical protein KC337_g13332, partial [Hortaea werneckii]
MPPTIPLPLPPQSPNNLNITPAAAAVETGPSTQLLRRKAYKQLLQNERAAIKTHLDRFIAATTTSTPSSFSFSSSSSSEAATDRWRILLAQRAEKVRDRVSRGKGSVQATFPDFWDEGREVEWLKRGWREFLGGGAWGTG